MALGPSAALAKAVRDVVRTFLADTGKLCDVREGGRPTAIAGEWYYAIHPASVQGQTAQTTHLDNEHSFRITISRRSGFAPNDRQGDAILLNEIGLQDRADAIADHLHGRAEIVTKANQYVGATATMGFSEPPRFRSFSDTVERGAEWFFSENDAHCGLSITLAFDGVRYQKDKR